MIGEHEWMIENLRVTHYNNEDPIPHVTNNSEWASLGTGAYCFYNNEESLAGTYGMLYNWYAADDERGLCPEGWRVEGEGSANSIPRRVNISINAVFK